MHETADIHRPQVSTGIDKCRAVNYNAWHKAVKCR
jgi:hypothetical protein